MTTHKTVCLEDLGICFTAKKAQAGWTYQMDDSEVCGQHRSYKVYSNQKGILVAVLAK